MDKTSIGNRMKGYERVSKSKLMRRTPVILRLDGKAFHTWTRYLKTCDPSLNHSPFSDKMHELMSHTAECLCDNIQNARLTYTQSDEISILLNDWGGLKTDQWFDGNIQKIVSVSASMATGYFNTELQKIYPAAPVAFFDARIFNLPKEEVANYFVWRQQDATRNSINMLGQYYFSHKHLQGKNTDQVQGMLWEQHDVNWNDIETWKKRGYCSTPWCGRDDHIPVFTKQRDYIEQHLVTKDE